MSTNTAQTVKTASSRPMLWTSDMPVIMNLSGCIAIRDLANLEGIEQGHHIILVDKSTPEALVRKAIYEISEAGSTAKIYKSHIPLECFVNHESTTIPEVLIQIIDFSIDYELYLDSLNEPLTIREFQKIATVILTYSNSPELEIEELRSRYKGYGSNLNKVIDEIKSSFSQQVQVIDKKSGIGSTDSEFGTDSCNIDVSRFRATVSSVREILSFGLTDYEEQQLLEDLYSKSGLSKSAFWKLVSSQKNQIDALQPGDEIRLNNLINWRNSELDFDKALPCMASDFKHDAKILNIDPIMLWQSLLPAVHSQVGTKINLDVGSHKIPCIAWTISLAESGTGKTRADDVILSPLRDLQRQYRKQFEHEMREWEEACAKLKGDEPRPPKPVERKVSFQVATIQAVMRRASEQEPGGQLWNRDELAGLFKSLGQFGKGENEGLECLIKLWDGSSFQNDRVNNQEDSYFIDKTAISLNGGMQPGIFRDIFKDPKDSQGLTARPLFATPKAIKPKRVKGSCILPEKLPLLYAWLRRLPEGTIKLSKAADALYDKLYEQIGNQAFETSHPAIRAWLFKLMGSNLLRIALGLHFLECYHDQNRPIWELQKDTLERAVLFAQYYRSAFHIIQETTTDNDDIASILLKIFDAAVTKHPDGITTRDAYRNINAITYRAKDMGRDVGAYTAELFGMLETQGKGKVVKNGRTIRFVASIGAQTTQPESIVTELDIEQNLIDENTLSEPEEQVEPEEKNSNTTDNVTKPETNTSKELEVSVPNQVSVPTVKDYQPEQGKEPPETSDTESDNNVVEDTEQSVKSESNSNNNETLNHTPNNTVGDSKKGFDPNIYIDGNAKPNYNVGDKVRYVGTDPDSKKQCEGELRVYSFDHKKVCVQKVDGNISTWHDYQDFRKV
ncbi:hypothetical protein NIES2101_38140 [Calothrix sp. HK-06]|nr:hypothetical protein NIES2101_38140 [Calothrix sp. HK-06]